MADVTQGSSSSDVLQSVMRTGKETRRLLGADRIERFISAQPGIVGPVSILSTRSNDGVGASSGIVLFRATYDAGAGSVTRDLVLRHAPGSEARLFFDYDMARQFRVQRALQGSGAPVPEPLWLDAEGAWLGVPGFVMALTEGQAPTAAAFSQGPLAQAGAKDREIMLDQVFSALVRIHRLDTSAHDLDDFAMAAEGDSPVARYVNWYWQTAEWVGPKALGRLAALRSALLDGAPTTGSTLIHGDATLHNYMFMGNRLTGILDWEMSCIARPECDLAQQMISNRLFADPGGAPGTQPPSEEEWVERYVRAGGNPPENLVYFRRLAAYIVLVAVYSLQRSMDEATRSAQSQFMDKVWSLAET